jgi:hypothetical protein
MRTRWDGMAAGWDDKIFPLASQPVALRWDDGILAAAQSAGWLLGDFDDGPEPSHLFFILLASTGG